MVKIEYKSIEEGDRLVCNVMSNGDIIPVEHIVTKTGLDMLGIRQDTKKEVVILGASILEHHKKDAYVHVDIVSYTSD